MSRNQSLTDWLREQIAFGREQRRLEFKPAGSPANKSLRASVVRAVLALGNTSSGGHVVIGVNETAGAFEPRGLTPEELASWRSDLTHDAIRPYVDPQPEVLVQEIRLDGRAFVRLAVTEFREVPFLCRKTETVGGRVALREGALYVRAIMKPESVEVSTYAQMRDLMDLATEKVLARYLRTAHRAGGVVSATAPDDEEHFRKQRGDLE